MFNTIESLNCKTDIFLYTTKSNQIWTQKKYAEQAFCPAPLHKQAAPKGQSPLQLEEGLSSGHAFLEVWADFFIKYFQKRIGSLVKWPNQWDILFCYNNFLKFFLGGFGWNSFSE